VHESCAAKRAISVGNAHERDSRKKDESRGARVDDFRHHGDDGVAANAEGDAREEVLVALRGLGPFGAVGGTQRRNGLRAGAVLPQATKPRARYDPSSCERREREDSWQEKYRGALTSGRLR